MKYLEISFKITPSYPGMSLLTQYLADVGFESFAEEENILLAYIQEEQFETGCLDFEKKSMFNLFKIEFNKKSIEQKNWNEEWEKNYPDVVIAEKCRIRAPFHTPDDSIEFEILIEPKMSFGTAHHETTHQMIERVLQLDVKDKSLLDMGSGTGVLGILAAMKGASDIVAIDNDEWAYLNAIENFDQNKIQNVRVILGDEHSIPDDRYDVILANINKNILLQSLDSYRLSLKSGGVLLMSGFYKSDIPDLLRKAESLGMTKQYNSSMNNWAVLELKA